MYYTKCYEAQSVGGKEHLEYHSIILSHKKDRQNWKQELETIIGSFCDKYYAELPIIILENKNCNRT